MDSTLQRSDAALTRRCRRIAAGGAGLTAAYWVASFAGVNDRLLNFACELVLIAVLPITWWAYRAATGSSKRFVALAALAVTAHTIGMVLWYVAYLGDHGQALARIGPWTPAFYLALGFEAAATWTLLRDILRARDAMLGRGGALTLSISLVVAALGAAAGGQMWAAIAQTHHAYTSNRGPQLLWCTSTTLILLAALTVISRRDHPLRVSRSAVPGISPAPLAVIITAAWAATGAVLVHGLVTSDTYEVVAGAGAVAWVAVAAVARTALALRETRHAYLALDVAHFALEQEREHVQELVDERDEVIATLQRRNIELTTTQIMLGPLLDLVDERSDGELRLRLEETADDLTSWLPLHRDSDE